MPALLAVAQFLGMTLWFSATAASGACSPGSGGTGARFLLTIVSMRLVPMAAAWVGWQWVFLLLVPGPLLGAVAMRRLETGWEPVR
ncbi:MAG: hypothetical protein ABIS06_18885 [Vicinamibacterales bacterium]